MTTMTTSRRTPGRRTGPMALALLAALSLAACADDDAESNAPAPVQAVPVSVAAASEPATLTITAADYAFSDVPDVVPAGTRLSIRNVSRTELHELVAFRIPDGETRSVAELVALPPQEMAAALGGAPRAVVAQAPGGEVIHALGDGRLTEPGRYAILCAIPTGADPGEYLEAAAASPGGPPQGVAGGPPHLVHGMVAELRVG